MSRAQANLLRAFSLWTLYVWGFRIFTIVGDDERSTGFKVVHSALAVVSVAFAIATGVVVARVRRATATAASREDEHSMTDPDGPPSGHREASHF